MKVFHTIYVDKETGICVTIDTTTAIVTSSKGDSVKAYKDKNGKLQLFDAMYSTPEKIVSAALNFFEY